jgi:hypothetical protein
MRPYRHDGNYVEPPRRQNEFAKMNSLMCHSGSSTVAYSERVRRLYDLLVRLTQYLRISWRLGVLAVGKGFPLYLGGSETHV